jgi:putative ABC transport system substrate-binding protein
MIALTRRRMLGLASAFGVAGLIPDTGLGAGINRPFHIYMVLGRGEGDNEAGFKDYLRRRGIPTRYTISNPQGDPRQLAEIRADIQRQRPDLIYTYGTPQTLGIAGRWDDPSTAGYITDIPVVFTFVASPVDAGIVRALDHPGRNVTGTIHIAPMAVQLNTLLTYRKIARLGVLYNPAEHNSVLVVEELRREVPLHAVTLLEAPVPLDATGHPTAAAIPDLIQGLAGQGAEMLYIGPDTFVAGIHRELVAETALAARLPTFSVTETIVRKNGALFGLTSSASAIGRFTALKAAKILVEGKRPDEIPVETLQRFSILINMPTARALQFYPPMGLLNLAEVIHD